MSFEEIDEQNRKNAERRREKFANMSTEKNQNLELNTMSDIETMLIICYFKCEKL